MSERPNVGLVHGACADGYTVTATQSPMTTREANLARSYRDASRRPRSRRSHFTSAKTRGTLRK